MSEERRKLTFGFLFLGMTIGLALSVTAAKQDHSVLWMIAGPILRAIAGEMLERWDGRRT